MSRNSRILKKSYAMQRMARAIERAVGAATGKEKERAARWVGAWGMLCGIKSSTVRLRQSEVGRGTDAHIRQPSGQIDLSGESDHSAAGAVEPSNDAPSTQLAYPLNVSDQGGAAAPA